MTLNLATLYEAVAAAVPGRGALVCGERRLRAAGIAPGEHVGVHMLNGTEYVETLLGCLKIRAVPVNINYRYTDRELHYLYTDAGLAGLVVDEEFAPAAARVAGDCPGLRVVTVVRTGEAADGPDRPDKPDKPEWPSHVERVAAVVGLRPGHRGGAARPLPRAARRLQDPCAGQVHRAGRLLPKRQGRLRLGQARPRWGRPVRSGTPAAGPVPARRRGGHGTGAPGAVSAARTSGK